MKNFDFSSCAMTGSMIVDIPLKRSCNNFHIMLQLGNRSDTTCCQLFGNCEEKLNLDLVTKLLQQALRTLSTGQFYDVDMISLAKKLGMRTSSVKSLVNIKLM